MAEVKLTLSLFLLELPDPNEDLYIQQSYTLKTFELFPKLPLELRHKIWKHTFPGPRHVCMDIIFCGDSGTLGERCSRYDHRSETKQLPIALSINRESRQETLRTYSLFYRSDFTSKYLWGVRGRVRACKKNKLPICIDPKVDVVCMGSTSFAHDSGIDRFQAWLEHIESHVGPKFLQSIAKVEIDDFLPHEYEDFEEAQAGLEDGRDSEASFPAGLMCFTGMKRLNIDIFDSDFKSMNTRTKEAVAIGENMNEWLKVRKDKFVGGKVPSIFVWPQSGDGYIQVHSSEVEQGQIHA